MAQHTCSRTDLATTSRGGIAKSQLAAHLQRYHRDLWDREIASDVPATALSIAFLRGLFNEAHRANEVAQVERLRSQIATTNTAARMAARIRVSLNVYVDSFETAKEFEDSLQRYAASYVYEDWSITNGLGGVQSDKVVDWWTKGR